MRQITYVVGTIIAFLLAGVVFFQPENRELDRPVPLPNVDLITQDGNAATQEEFKGRWSFVYLGYTFCPDFCPAALGQMREVKASLKAGPHLSNLHFVFISLDPKRDTASRLKSYLAFYDPEFLGYTGSKPDLDALVAGLGQVYGFSDPNKNNYEVYHPNVFFLINDRGEYVRRFEEPGNIEQIRQGLIESIFRVRDKK